MNATMTTLKPIAMSVLLGTLVAMSGSALAGDPEAGKDASESCAACHGVDGNSTTASFPKIAGQYESYLIHALKAYRSGDRVNASMSGFAAVLTDKQIADLAAYFSSQESGLRTVERK